MPEHTASAADISAVLEIAKRSAERRAIAESWPYEEQTVRGGKKRLYRVADLPEDVRTAVAKHQLAAAAPKLPAPLNHAANHNVIPTQAAAPARALANLTKYEYDVAVARAAVLDEVARIAHAAGERRAIRIFISAVERGEVDETMLAIVRQANARAGESRGLSRATLHLWQKLVRGIRSPIARITALAPHTRGKQWGLQADVAQVLALYRQPNKPSLAWCVHEILRDSQGSFNALYKRCERQVNKLPAPVLYVGRNAGAALRALQPFRRREFQHLLPNDVWTGDGHGAKLRIAHPETGKPFVPEVTVIMDVQSRFVVGWSVSLSENKLAVSDALRHAMSRHGVPLIYYSDNGSGQTADMLDAPLTGILPAMGVQHETGIPGNPQGRGVIERFWQTLLIPLARRFATYQGKNADRDTLRQVSAEIDKQLRAIARGGEVIALPEKLPTFAQFIDTLSAEIEHYNQHHAHRSLGGATPAQRRAQRIGEAEIYTPPASDIATLFMPSVLRKAARGEVRLWNGIYFNRDLMLVDDQTVRVCYDIHDVSYVVVRQLSGEVIARAELNGNRSGFFPQTTVERLRDERAKNRTRLLETKLAAVREEHAANALPAAADMEEAERAALAEDIRKVEIKQLHADHAEHDDWADYNRCKAIEWRLQDGENVSDADRAWFDSYTQSSDYRVFDGLAKDFPQKVRARQ